MPLANTVSAPIHHHGLGSPTSPLETSLVVAAEHTSQSLDAGSIYVWDTSCAGNHLELEQAVVLAENEFFVIRNAASRDATIHIFGVVGKVEVIDGVAIAIGSFAAYSLPRNRALLFAGNATAGTIHTYYL